MACAWCHNRLPNKGRILHYKDLDFCDWDCLGDYLIDQVGSEVEEESIEPLSPEEEKYWAEFEAGAEKAAIRRDLEGIYETEQ